MMSSSADKKKLLRVGDRDVVVYEYSPTRQSFNTKKIQVTRNCIYHFRSFDEGFDAIYYEDLISITVSSDFVDLESTQRNVRFQSYRPHLNAVNLWMNIACNVLSCAHIFSRDQFSNLRALKKSVSAISQMNVNTLCIPFDFNVPDELKAIVDQFGLIFDVNRCPRIDWYKSVRNAGEFSFNSAITAGVGSNENNEVINRLNSSFVPRLIRIKMPILLVGVSQYTLERWLCPDGAEVIENQPVLEISRRLQYEQRTFTLKSNNTGIIKHLQNEDTVISAGSLLAYIRPIETAAPLSTNVSIRSTTRPSVNAMTTSSVIRGGGLNIAAGEIPIFQPSIAKEPVGFDSTGSYEDDLKIALQNPHTHFQSFFNDQSVLSFDNLSIVNDDVINLPCFDEDLYCRVVREMHRFTIAEIIDKKEDLAKENANLGALVGGLLGVVTFNPFAPFFGRNVGHSMTDKGKKVDEFLPDPNLLFSQDPNSFLSWSRAQVNKPRLRRLIIHRQEKQNNKVFFRLLPAFVTSDSIFPIQLFKLNSTTYFYRPFSAGIEKRDQPNYDCIKIQRRYFHLRSEGQSEPTDVKVEIRGRDVDIDKLRLYRYIDQSLDYFYVDFKVQPGSVF